MKNKNTILWILRIAVAGEFLGHGVLALKGKEDWIGWLSKFGVTDTYIAIKILFIIGLLDVILAGLVLLRPIRLLYLWMAFWGFFTAFLRPILGEPIWDFVERFANWGAPLALFFLSKKVPPEDKY